jgi:hypothetical protein
MLLLLTLELVLDLPAIAAREDGGDEGEVGAVLSQGLVEALGLAFAPRLGVRVRVRGRGRGRVRVRGRGRGRGRDSGRGRVRVRGRVWGRGRGRGRGSVSPLPHGIAAARLRYEHDVTGAPSSSMPSPPVSMPGPDGMLAVTWWGWRWGRG